jgi:hypothetical protein
VSWLLGIPARAWEVLLAAGLALALLGVAVHHERQVGARKAQATLAAERARAVSAATAATAANQAEGDRRSAALKDIADESQRLSTRAVVDAADAHAAAGRLLERVADGRAAACHPAAPGSGPAADAASPVLDDVLPRVLEAAGQLAAYADQARIAGDACQRSYDALTRPPAPIGQETVHSAAGADPPPP